MDLHTNRQALLLMRQVLDRKKAVTPRLVTPPQKVAYDDSHPLLQPFPRSSPETQGVPADRVAGFLQALKDDESLDLHGVMILRHGQVIAEATFGAYDQRVWHITHSECKSITGLAIGMLIDDGLLNLDDRILRFFEKRALPLALLTHKNMTIRHLLTMSSGVLFNEAGAITEKDWVKCFLESAVIFEPGSRFTYNSMNTYLLSAIVREASGRSLMDFLAERLWQPLGITGVYWETCPKGIEKGGWGLYIRPEDIAKIGQLVLQNGRWQDRQLVSEKWIRAATSKQIATPANLCDYDYGYQIWTSRRRNAFLFNGMFGQNILGLRDSDMLILINAGNDEFFQQSSFFRLAEAFFPADLPDSRHLPDSRKGSRQLQAVKTSLTLPEGSRKSNWLQRLVSLPEIDRSAFCTALDGRILIPDAVDAAAVGLLPLLAQLVQNNFTKGLKSLVFRQIDGELQLTVNEKDESHRLLIGFDSPRITDLVIHGEPYRVAVTGRLTTDEDDHLVLKVRVSFLEIANARIIKFYFKGDHVVTRWSELPGRTFFLNAFTLVKNEVKSYPMIEGLIDKANNDFVRYKISSCIEPEVRFNE